LRVILKNASTCMKKRILIISDSYPPEIRSAAHLMQQLAVGFVARGHEVCVVTSYPAYNLAGEARDFDRVSVEDGVRVIRVKTLPHHRVNFIIRGIAQLVMPFLFMRAIAGEVDALDEVILHSPPLPLSLVLQWTKRRYGVHTILNLHDFFPQLAIDLGAMTNVFLVGFFRWMERRAYRLTDAIVVPSEKHKAFLALKHEVDQKKIGIVEHWIDVKNFEEASPTGVFRKRFGVEGKFVFLFAGVLGPSQGLDLVLRVAQNIDNKDVTFLLVGEGMEKKNLQRKVRKKNISNVVFAPFVSPLEYPSLVKECDVALLTLTSKNTTPAVPAKLMGYMAAGVPVIAFLHKQSDGHSIIKEAHCGFSVLSDDFEGALGIVKKCIHERKELSALGTNGLAYAKKHFNTDDCAEKFEKFFN